MKTLFSSRKLVAQALKVLIMSVCQDVRPERPLSFLDFKVRTRWRLMRYTGNVPTTVGFLPDKDLPRWPCPISTSILLTVFLVLFGGLVFLKKIGSIFLAIGVNNSTESCQKDNPRNKPRIPPTSEMKEKAV